MIARPLRVTAFLALFAPAAALAQAPPPSGPAEPTVKTVEFEAKSVGRTMKFNIALPPKYEESRTRYPVLYLLHGYSSNYLAWNRLGAPKYTREFDLIVVMPDAGNSWYANWSRSEDDQKNAWEDFMIKDLIGHVDANYRTLARREGRAINGLSMGGYGALMLGLRHPDLFCSIGSHSGAVAFARSAAERLRSGEDPAKKAATRKLSDRPVPEIGIEGFSSQVERSPKGKLWATAEEADGHDPFKLVLSVPKEKLPHIYVDCGTEDRLLKSNQDFVKVLMDNKVPFTYAESAGGHTGPYWAREVGHSMAVQYHLIRRNLSRAEREAKAEQP
jgi:S-formylglutathione hydrolase FrmB